MVDALRMFVCPFFAEAFLFGLLVNVQLHLIGVMFGTFGVAAAVGMYRSERRQSAAFGPVGEQDV